MASPTLQKSELQPPVRPKHHGILKQGVESWNQWRTKNPGVTPDLSWANLSAADLGEAGLSGAVSLESDDDWEALKDW